MRHYSIWFKPAGLLTQGTSFGDHCSLMRQAELFFKSGRCVYLVHRLDREVTGLVIFAHSRESAGKLSELFQRHEIRKQYLIEVSGNIGEHMQHGVLTMPLNGKDAHTEFKTVSYDSDRNTSIVHVDIKTGRTHQIRRHFEMIGFPVMGDPLYGKGNKNSDGLKIAAKTIRFRCPFTHQDVTFDLSDFYSGLDPLRLRNICHRSGHEAKTTEDRIY